MSADVVPMGKIKVDDLTVSNIRMQSFNLALQFHQWSASLQGSVGATEDMVDTARKIESYVRNG